MHWKNCVNKILLWDKEARDFVSILPTSSARVYETRCINPEQLNLNGMIVRLAYLPLPKVMESRNNNTGLAGYFGDAWYLVGYYLNFTILAENLDIRHHNNILDQGFNSVNAQLMKSNKTDIAMPMRYDKKFLTVLDYLSMISFCNRLYVPPSFKSDDAWLFRMITYDILLIILMFMILMSTLSCFFDKYKAGYRNINSPLISFCDNFFYTFATFTNQGSATPFYAENRSWMLSITKKMLAWLFLIMSTGNLFYLMSKIQIDAPFTDITSLLDKSDMHVMIPTHLKGWHESVVRLSSAEQNRVHFFTSPEKMYEEVCQNHTKVALWQNELVQRTVGREYNCNLISLGPCTTRENVILAISRNFPYPRSLMIGILKIQESGLLDIAERRWIKAPLPLNPEQYHDVSWKDVKIIFMIYLGGVVTSIMILMIENIYSVHKRHRLWMKWNRQLRRMAEHLRSQRQY